jgi:hypothetical protein
LLFGAGCTSQATGGNETEIEDSTIKEFEESNIAQTEPFSNTSQADVYGLRVISPIEYYWIQRDGMLITFSSDSNR